MTNTKLRAPRTQPAVRREQIVDAAIEVFGISGFRQGSLKDVAGRVGLTVQGVLHHFSTKEALLLETLERRNALRAGEIDRVLAEDGTVALLRMILVQNIEYPGLMRLFVTLAAESTDEQHPAHDYFVERYRSFHQRIRDSFVYDVNVGRAVDADPDRTAEELIALSDGLQLQRLLNPRMDLLRSFDAAVAHLIPASPQS